MNKPQDHEIYQRQRFGQRLALGPPAGLLIVDFIEGFVDPGVFGGGNIQAAVDRTVELLAFARSSNWSICFSRTEFAEDGSDSNVFSEKVPGNLLLTEQSGYSRVVMSLAPRKGELVVRKQVPSAFFATPLSSWLTMKGVKTLVVAGATTSGCVRASVVDAMCYGFKPVVAEDCVGDRSPEAHKANLFDMKMKYADVIALAEIEKLLALRTAEI